MNALRVNPYTERWAALGSTLPKPEAILSVSAHWYIQDAAINAVMIRGHLSMFEPLARH
jgi:4,5-DOPA dioxygenase extradiol